MKTVKEVMLREMPLIEADATVKEIVEKMRDEKKYYFIVTDAGKPVGILTDGDLLRFFYMQIANYWEQFRHCSKESPHYQEMRDELESRIRVFSGLKARDLMNKRLKTVGEDMMTGEACEFLKRGNLKRAPVVDSQGKIVGVLNRLHIVGSVL